MLLKREKYLNQLIEAKENDLRTRTSCIDS